MKHLPLLSALSLLAACSSEPPDHSSAAGAQARGAVVAQRNSAAGPAASAPGPAAATPTTYQLLQGKWQSTEDAKSVIMLKGHRYTDYYDGQQVGTAAFILDRGCPATPEAGHPGDNEKYLVQPREGMCWEVVDVDDHSLRLIYTARGNTLGYRKVQ